VKVNLTGTTPRLTLNTLDPSALIGCWICATNGGGTITIAQGSFNPEINWVLIGAPVVASYSATVPIPFTFSRDPKVSATYSFPPYTAIPLGAVNPETSVGLIGAPVLASHTPTHAWVVSW